jgi:hypothetical protein
MLRPTIEGECIRSPAGQTDGHYSGANFRENDVRRETYGKGLQSEERFVS